MKSHYKGLALEVGIHFVIMYAVMYTMVHTFDDVFLNINNFYMTGMMVTPMIAIMLVTMKSMFGNRRLNLVLYVSSLIAFVALFYFERNQTFVGDRQFLRSMIPHHSGAILMCGKSSLTDQELITLCEEIIANQKKEIDQMKSILQRLDSGE